MKKYLILSLTIALTLTWAHSYSLPKCETDDCQVCSSFGICVMCTSNYLLAINKETKVSQCRRQDCSIEGCSRCLSEDICAQCEREYKLDSSGSCSLINEDQIQGQKSLELCLRRSFTGKCLQCRDNNLDLEEGECYFKKLTLSNLAAVACTTSIQNCTSCLTPNYCTSCKDGLVPSADGLTCITNCTISNCYLCATSTTCGICNNGYVLHQNNTACIQCSLTGCSLCSSNNVCQTCSFGYALNTTSSTCYLANCQYPCSTCGYNGQCTSCFPPFSPVPFSNGTCFTCRIPNCQSCDPNFISTCSQCYSGYVYNAVNNTCNWGTPNPLCIAINANGSCTQCVPGYTVVQSACSPCANAGICMVCSSANTSICTQCQVGYYVPTGDHTCKVCQYSNCAINSCLSAEICIDFVPSSGLQVYISTTLSTQTYFPYSCDIGCAQCASNYPTLCLLCSPGFYIVSNSNTNNVPMCLPCLGNCLTCLPNNPSYCLSCYSNSYLLTNSSQSTCQVCDPNSNCLTCSSSNPSICTTCPFGYYLTSTTINKVTRTTCQALCPSGCLTCFNAQGTQLSSLNPNNIVCSSCEPGFSLSMTGSCLPCTINCRVCSGSYQSICLYCGYGFYLDELYQCQPCQPYCLTCNQQGCLTCIAGYYVQPDSYNGMVCVPACNFPCASCSSYFPNQCTQCVFGYTLIPSQNSCQLSSCVTNKTNACQNCPPGSVLSNGICNVCEGGCARCAPSNPQICIGCFAGMYLAGSSCYSCPSGCQTCSSPLNCLSCASGFATLTTPIAVNKVMCVPCAPPCSQCTDSPQLCTSCEFGFFLSGWNCQSKLDYYFNASFLVGPQVFFNNYYEAVVNKITYGLQTTNKYSVNVQFFQTTASSTTFLILISTIQKNDTDKFALEYKNLQFAIGGQDGFIVGLPVVNNTLLHNGRIPSTYSPVPMYCAIFVPLGVVVIAAIVYFVCSRTGGDLSGSSYVPPDSSERQRQFTEMVAL